MGFSFFSFFFESIIIAISNIYQFFYFKNQKNKICVKS
jgi:hypothetical protein